MATTEDTAKHVFGARAAFYTSSAAHTDPQVLARVVECAAPAANWSALDIATGTGHTAFALAPHVASVIATDLTRQMLAEAVRLRQTQHVDNVAFAASDVHHLPFPDGAFALVTCRRAAHHFSAIMRALSEMHRVLQPGGRLVIDDRTIPEDDFLDACMNTLDRYHDPSHVRQYRLSEWQAMLAASSFRLDVAEPYERHRPLSVFTHGVDAGTVARIEALLASLSAVQRAALNLTDVAGEPHLTHWYVLLAATRI